MLKGKTFRIGIMLGLTLTMALFSVASVLTAVSAAPDGTEFEAILWGAGPPFELKREWIDGHGFTHLLGIVMKHTGVTYPHIPSVEIYSITDNTFNKIGIVVKGTGDIIIDMEEPEPSLDGHMAMRAEIILDGETYRLRLSGPVNEGIFSIPFVIVGREGLIVGIASGSMGNPAMQLSGTWVR